MPLPQKPLKSCTPPLLYDPLAVDIAAISTIIFYFNMYRRDNEVFITSLYKIDWIIAKREKELAKEIDEELVKCLFPIIYIKYKNIFLKAALDKLPPHQIYNHKIQLEANNLLGYSPFYQQLIDKLKATK